MKPFLLIFLLLSFINGNAQQPAAAIPEFSFEKQDRSSFTRKDMAPATLAFFVFFDTECDHCRHAIEYLDKHQAELAKTKLYLITLDPKEKVEPFLEKHGRTLRKAKNTLLLFDTKNQFITRFGPRKYPSLMLYSGNGKLLLYGDDEKNLPGFMDRIKKN